jgi:hypothetical protein
LYIQYPVCVNIDQFIYLPEFCIIVYKRCQYTILPSYIDIYFIASNRLKEAGINTRFYRAVGRKEGAQEEEGIQADTEEGKGVEVIVQQLKVLQESYKSMIAVIDRLQGSRYIYCQLIIKGRETGEGILQESGSQVQLYIYNNCPEAEADKYRFAVYQQ